MLISVPLTGTNYHSWCRSMMTALRAKDKIGYINGKCAAPEEDSSNFKKWQRDCGSLPVTTRKSDRYRR
uniref:Retrotransposon Copia-like N-terminal domain-containing protein n=1 Tax=Manihot esculenta TaxID=3983 RepID=A0A2C9US78_MANES